jgi:hypothetical protein
MLHWSHYTVMALGGSNSSVPNAPGALATIYGLSQGRQLFCTGRETERLVEPDKFESAFPESSSLGQPIGASTAIRDGPEYAP